jgi:hypothetical protein
VGVLNLPENEPNNLSFPQWYASKSYQSEILNYMIDLQTDTYCAPGSFFYFMEKHLFGGTILAGLA